MLPIPYRSSAGLVFLLATMFSISRSTQAEETLESRRTPVNQVFQFMQNGMHIWGNGQKSEATAYLWIPENCRHLRGLLILCTNVPEHTLVGHSSIRQVCAANDLGIVWCVPTFMNFQTKYDYQNITGFLQELLDGLARTSGYQEVATVPWLPMGESGHLLMVDALVEHSPGRCIAGIWINNCHLPPKNRETPALITEGTAQEWDQEKVDIRTKWNALRFYDNVLKQRKIHPRWPLSLVVDGWGGHFDCSERAVQYFARYIALAAKARLSVDGTPTLKTVALDRGFLADLPVPGHENHPALAFDKAAPAERAVPWYFDRASAEQAQGFAAINWKAETQLPAFVDAKGKIAPFNFRGIPSMVPQLTEADCITFSLRGTLLERLPDHFVGAGDKLAQAPGTPMVEWICGPVAPLGNGRFQIALDRTWPHTNPYLAVRQRGTDKIRGVVEPGHIQLRRNSEGVPQTIKFSKIRDVKAGTAFLPLEAHSSADLPVHFFVVAGPAIVQDGKLVFTKVPPRTRYPVAVTVVAWQWGRCIEPKVQTAEIAKQSFHIMAP